MKSMTGYGSATVSRAGTEISVVMKAVNGRFFETRMHLPKEYFSQESQLKKILSEVVQRGTIDVFVHRKATNHARIQFNSQLARDWNKAFRDLSKSLGTQISDEAIFSRVSSIPQIFEIGEHRNLQKRDSLLLIEAFRKALIKLEVERLREGQSLSKHLLKILRDLNLVVRDIEQRRQKSNLEMEDRLRERLKKALGDSPVEPSRMAQELIFYLDRGDISEEIVRLKEHFHMCAKHIRNKSAQGKKLDFYSQELLREINTIGSKANDGELTSYVVKAKGLIESFKEQVQNVE